MSSKHETYAYEKTRTLHCPQDNEKSARLREESGTLMGDIRYQCTKAIGRVVYRDKDGFSQIRDGWLKRWFG